MSVTSSTALVYVVRPAMGILRHLRPGRFSPPHLPAPWGAADPSHSGTPCWPRTVLAVDPSDDGPPLATSTTTKRVLLCRVRGPSPTGHDPSTSNENTPSKAHHELQRRRTAETTAPTEGTIARRLDRSRGPSTWGVWLPLPALVPHPRRICRLSGCSDGDALHGLGLGL